MENNTMNEPDDEGLKDNTKDDQREISEPLVFQQQQKYPNNLTDLCKQKKLSPRLIINKMNRMLQQELVVENYTGWVNGDHLPSIERREALVKILEVESELDIWPTLIQI